MRLIIDCLYLVAIVFISPKIIYRMVRRGRYRSGWDERLGKIRRRSPEKKCIWIHAVSVGEVNATKSLIPKLKESFGDYEVVISSTTDTGLERAKALYEKNLSVFYFPFDLSCVMRRAFDNIRPGMCLLMELEVWPNLARIANEKKVPVAVVNGRLSDESFPKYRLVKPISRWMFAKVDLVLAQTEEYAARFRLLGCAPEKVIVTNSLKYDTAQITDKVDGADKLAHRLNIAEERLWVAGGTGPGEEKVCLDVFKKLKKQARFADLRLAIVPRKPERFDEVAALVADAGFESVRYSRIKAGQSTSASKPPVILGDTMGDLTKFYSLAKIVFVGRSLVPMGGSDMMESAALGKCTIFGPHTFNFKQTADELLKAGGAVRVNNADELSGTVEKCLTDTTYAVQIAANGREVIKQNQGATDRTVKAITNLLKS
ncbi:MAG TPA: 3-deoxy-D-manno-octulosonic acid transferase [Planctomycetes bacterium]|nr:3-deoxy-D-manno-octulosonic acid transferase [Planctomycetota bacterium]